MADFNPAFDKMIHSEGGFQLIDIAADQGGHGSLTVFANKVKRFEG